MFTQEQICNLASTIKDTEHVVYNLPIVKASSLHGFTRKFYQTFKEKIIVITHKLYEKIEEKGILPN